MTVLNALRLADALALADNDSDDRDDTDDDADDETIMMSLKLMMSESHWQMASRSI